MSARKPLKRSVQWWSWAEWRARDEGQIEALIKAERDWSPRGRVELVVYVDGSAEFRFPWRRGRTTGVFSVSADLSS